MSVAFNRPLQGANILVAEDNAILAFDLGITLEMAGARIVGPAATLAHALSLAQTVPLSAAVLDVSLRDEDVLPAAVVLKRRGIGIVFCTGYAYVDQLKRDWPDAQILTKPASARTPGASRRPRGEPWRHRSGPPRFLNAPSRSEA